MSRAPLPGRLRAAPGRPPVELPDIRTALFTDLHLRAGAPEEVAAFGRSLAGLPPEVRALVVMGDLFDAWTGPGQWSEPWLAPLRVELTGLAQRGVRVILLRGNRDVMLEPADGGVVGAAVEDAVILPCGGERVLVTHGDEYCLRDRPYQRLRRVLRSRPLRWAARRLHRRARRWAASHLRRASRAAVARKPLDTLALVEEAVSEALSRHGAHRALIGHFHVAVEQDLEGGGSLCILPAWAPGSPPVLLGPGLGSQGLRP